MNESSPSPPSSPPEGHLSEMLTTTRKRSHEEMNEKASDAQGSSSTVIGEGDAASTQSKQDKKEMSSATTMKQSTASNSVPPPALPASKRDSQRPPRSGQGSAPNSQTPKQPEPRAKTTTDAPAAKQNLDVDPESSTDDEEDDAEQPDSPMQDSEPHDEIETFDWDELQHRYHTKMKELNAKEDGIMNEFNGLCDYFAVWAQTGSAHEVDRSFKRMKTQMTLVQHHEDQLEDRRQHYIKVVDAFKSALALLTK